MSNYLHWIDLNPEYKDCYKCTSIGCVSDYSCCCRKDVEELCPTFKITNKEYFISQTIVKHKDVIDIQNAISEILDFVEKYLSNKQIPIKFNALFNPYNLAIAGMVTSASNLLIDFYEGFETLGVDFLRLGKTVDRVETVVAKLSTALLYNNYIRLKDIFRPCLDEETSGTSSIGGSVEDTNEQPVWQPVIKVNTRIWGCSKVDNIYDVNGFSALQYVVNIGYTPCTYITKFWDHIEAWPSFGYMPNVPNILISDLLRGVAISTYNALLDGMRGRLPDTDYNYYRNYLFSFINRVLDTLYVSPIDFHQYLVNLKGVLDSIKSYNIKPPALYGLMALDYAGILLTGFEYLMLLLVAKPLSLSCAIETVVSKILKCALSIKKNEETSVDTEISERIKYVVEKSLVFKHIEGEAEKQVETAINWMVLPLEVPSALFRYVHSILVQKTIDIAESYLGTRSGGTLR